MRPLARQFLNDCDHLKAENAKLRSALVGLVGADGEELLGPMAAELRSMPNSEDRRVMFTAIEVLRQTLPK